MTGGGDHWLLPDEPFESWAAYLAHHGSSAALDSRATSPATIIEELERSGLRGRGGAGFPTGLKWRTIANHACPVRYVVCNAAEGEPGTFKDRFLLRRNPYACLEGIAIAARVVGAKKAFIGVKESFKPELERLRAAILEMVAAGVFEDIELELVEGPGEYLFGEEKALLRFIEDGLPLPREAEAPPYELGLFGDQRSPNPALVNNVETFAHVASIVRAGGDSFRALGTHDTPGTVICTISGDVARPGVFEVEAGVPLSLLIDEQAGGVRGAPVKAVLAGISTRPIPADKLHTPVDFGSLALIGSGLGSAGFIVLDESRSMPRVAQTIARFLYVESCNQCTACKHGLGAASKAIDGMLAAGDRHPDDLERVVFGARSAPQGNRCYLPVQGSILLPALLARFRSEFEPLLRAPAADPERFPLPLLADYDEERRVFTYDDTTARKRPDWTYEPPLELVPSIPHSEPEGSVGVRLDPDVASALRERGSATGRQLDAIANEILREHLSSGKGR